MATSNVLTQDEYAQAYAVVQAILNGADLDLLGLTPGELDGQRIVAVTMDPQDDRGGFIPLAVVLTNELAAQIVPAEGPISLDGEEGVA